MPHVKSLTTLLLAAIIGLPIFAHAANAPVTPNASPEAAYLLNYLYEITGKKILTGQHNAPLNGANRLSSLHKQIGEYPAVFGQDFGFSAPGSWDGINFRQNIVDEAIAKHREGYIITLMWHAVLPSHDEPQEFKPSIQGQLTDKEWQELTTPGTHLNERWKSQVDVIAWHLKQLQYAKVPVLWRPYHEMNGDWFWWGYRTGPDGYAKLWTMLFDRLVNFHKIDNLIWVWNANELRNSAKEYAGYYPGHEYVDVLATDVYSGKYNKADYDQLLKLGNGRPIGLGEIGNLPTPQMLKAQPDWVWFMMWKDPEGYFWQLKDTLDALFKIPEATSLHELPWVVEGENVYGKKVKKFSK